METSKSEIKKLKIEFLVTHPAAAGVGGLLIEQAVNISEKSGHNGKINLETPFEEAKSAYQALGFKKSREELFGGLKEVFGQMHPHKPVELVLSPKNSKRWELDENTQWKLQCTAKQTRRAKNHTQNKKST